MCDYHVNPMVLNLFDLKAPQWGKKWLRNYDNSACFQTGIVDILN